MPINLKITHYLSTAFSALLIGVLLACATTSASASTNIIIYDDKSTYQQTFYEHLKTKLNNSHIKLVTLKHSDISAQQIKQHTPSLVINIDKKAPKQLINLKLNIPTVHALLTQADSEQYLSCVPSCHARQRQHHFFVLDQPPARQIALIKLVKTNTKDIGVIYSEQSKNQMQAIELNAGTQAFNVQPHLTTPEALGYNLNDMTKSADIILALADTVLYNQTTLPQILLTSYRYRTPVIGFSKGFVKAGAIAGVVSNLNQLASQLSEAILDVNQGHALISSGIIYPKYYNVVSNRRVANSLNIHFPSDSSLTNSLQSRELP